MKRKSGPRVGNSKVCCACMPDDEPVCDVYQCACGARWENVAKTKQVNDALLARMGRRAPKPKKKDG